MQPNKQINSGKGRYKKTLGVRLSGSTSLTGHVSSPRRNGTSSPVRHLHPPLYIGPLSRDEVLVLYPDHDKMAMLLSTVWMMSA